MSGQASSSKPDPRDSRMSEQKQNADGSIDYIDSEYKIKMKRNADGTHVGVSSGSNQSAYVPRIPDNLDKVERALWSLAHPIDAAKDKYHEVKGKGKK